MVHHIVMWKFKPEIEENKRPELKKAMKESLEGLVGKVPGLLNLEFVDWRKPKMSQCMPNIRPMSPRRIRI